MLNAISTALARAGHEVVVAAEVADALALVEAQELDCAIVDYNLPFDTGTTVLSALRRRRPRCGRLLLTGRSEGAVYLDAINTGAVDQIIPKPVGTSELLQAVEEILQQHGDLSGAVRREALRLALQPIVRIGSDGSRTPIAYEALLRPSHAVLDTPLALLEAAETHGWVLRLGSIVLQLAADRLADLPEELLLFVNLHPAQLGDPEGLRRDLAVLEPAAERVVFEITERLDLSGIGAWRTSIAELRRRGFSIAIDDLGGGHGTLTTLTQLRPHYIKIDMGLVRDLDQHPQQRDVISFLRGFGQTHSAAVIAEGVETQQELDALLECGIELVQGYYLGRPEP